MRDRLRRPLSARIETEVVSGIQASDVIERLLESYPREAIRCVQSVFGGKFMVTFANQSDKKEFVLQEHFRIRGHSFPIMDADTNFRYVKVRNWPYEITEEEIDSLLGSFGRISAVRRDSHLESGIPNGDITVLMSITTPIPSYLWFCGNQGYISYRDQQRTCRLCGSTEHFARDCPTCSKCRNRGHYTEDCPLPSCNDALEASMSPQWPPIQHATCQSTDFDLTLQAQQPTSPMEQQDSETISEKHEPRLEEMSSSEEELDLEESKAENTPMDGAAANTNVSDSSTSDSSSSDLEITHTIAIVDEGPKKRPAQRTPVKEESGANNRLLDNGRLLAERAAKRRKPMMDSASGVGDLTKGQTKESASDAKGLSKATKGPMKDSAGAKDPAKETRSQMQDSAINVRKDYVNNAKVPAKSTGEQRKESASIAKNPAKNTRGPKK